MLVNGMLKNAMTLLRIAPCLHMPFSLCAITRVVYQLDPKLIANIRQSSFSDAQPVSQRVVLLDLSDAHPGTVRLKTAPKSWSGVYAEDVYCCLQATATATATATAI